MRVAATAAGPVLVAALALAALVVSPPRAALAQQPPPDAALAVEAHFDPPSVLLGQRTRLTVSVSHDAGLLISAQALPPVDDLRLIEELAPTTESADGGLVTRFEYVLAGFAPGVVQPHGLVLSWLRADGVAGRLEVALPPLEVRLSAARGQGDLRPLKPQLALGAGPPALWWPWIPAAVLLALLAAGALVALRRRRDGPAEPGEPVDTPERAARAELDRLGARRLLDSAQFEAYYGTISAVVRGYLEARFRFRATALTTAELEARMTEQGVERWQARLVAGLLDRCDAAVYASRHPDPASADHDLTVAYEIVELARPALAAAP